MGTLEVFRVETFHAVLVHSTVGAVPLLVLTYAVALWRRSPQWTFTGDVVLFVTALLSLGSLGSGLLSNSLLTWPGGLEGWRVLHLALGVSSATLLTLFAVLRLLAARRRPHAGALSFAAALVVATVIGATGWVGGEVLVFHGGMAVKAAGDGALAPPASPREEKPDSLDASMGHVRGEWALMMTTLAVMLTEVPTEARYETVRHAAEVLARHARWLEEVGGPEVQARGQPPAQLRFMAGLLEKRASAVGEAASARDLSELSRAVGELGTSCAGCHDSFRWKDTPEPREGIAHRGETAAPDVPARVWESAGVFPIALDASVPIADPAF